MAADAFFALHAGLPRQAPGSDATTREALRRLGGLPERPRVADLGCGPGRSTLVLAAELRVPVVAVDAHAPFLAELEAAARASGLSALVVTRCADFAALEDPPGSYDLLWSEGAVYHLGFERGLAAWRRLLAAGGKAAVSELCWLREERERPPEAAAFWREAYPQMQTVAASSAAAQRAGYEVLDTLVLPAAAWDEYYGPLARRADELARDADPALAQAIAETRREIAVWRAAAGSYGYAFHLLRRT